MQCHFDDQEVCKMVIVGLQQLDKFEGAWAKFDPEGKKDSMHLSIKSSGITVDKFALSKMFKQSQKSIAGNACGRHHVV